jgi:hypothetical protein
VNDSALSDLQCKGIGLLAEIKILVNFKITKVTFALTFRF